MRSDSGESALSYEVEVMDQLQVAVNPPPAELNWPSSRQPACVDALRVLGLEKTYATGFWRRALPAVRGVSFVVPPGQVLALLGHNGAGKTTTIGCILGLVRPDAGEIALFGRDHRAPGARQRIGYLPEQPNFYEHLTGRELLRFYARLLEIPARHRNRAVEHWLERVGLAAAADRTLRKYSKGMLQRIGLAQALLGDPELLILDEPMSGLDPVGRHDVRDLLLEQRERGTTILLSSHIVPDVEAVADAAVFLRDGLLIEQHRIQRGAPLEYVVRADRVPDELQSDPPIARGGGLEAGDHTAARELAAPDPAALARLLDTCSRCGVTVLDVRARRAGLEELFLAAMGRSKETPC
jgi:ABC-2 type transport system ATP-binding protein